MRIRVFDTPQEAGIYVGALAEQVILAKAEPVLGLATGSTPVTFYDALVKLHDCGLDLSRVVTINLDEYVGLSEQHPQSYHYFMTEHLFSRVHLDPARTHLPRGDAPDWAAECARYDEVLSRHPIDLQILGIGANGHIGFNEPDDLLVARTHVVELRPETVASNARFFADSEEVPKRAITMGVQAILQAERIVLMAFGSQKAEIVAKAVIDNVRTDVPASILQLHRQVTVVLDRASASALLTADGKLRLEVAQGTQ
ncbi:MAG: glucosamine-6-phosphate deaminase [Firmicutes bacterium]|nr:glucosamine-6-phosphate deaminase [Bacillota bacterium]